MSRADAPLYVRSHDLARWVTERAQRWGGPMQAVLGVPLCEAATGLCVSISLALSFPAVRERHQQDADEAIVRLRERLRLARDLGLLSAGGARYAHGELLELGRMLGGWRKRERSRQAARLESDTPLSGPRPTPGPGA